ncbi:ABC transporter permease [Vibrio viridaestus]|uniref:ABC transporter permease n=1 Tax=Vibrio viridaestus TaxID=2487322 RepID=A0A3N9TIT4_9VIBR|nr:ABC transporter permease [Vibrio viridaestus]RQW63455.1 ABC transporter permease [Vibrio viridaestus]
MSWPVVKALLGHYRRYPLQFVLVWLGLTLGVSLFTGVIAINHHILKSYQHGEKLFANPLPYHIISRNLNDELPHSAFDDILKLGFSQCLPLERAELYSRSGEELTLIGVKSASPHAGLSIESLSHGQLKSSATKHTVLISSEFAETLGVKSGETIILSTGKKLGPVLVDGYNVVYGNRLLTLTKNTRLFKPNTDLTAITCGEMPFEDLQRLKSALPATMMLVRNHRSNFGTYTKALHMNLTAMGMLAFLVGLFIFYQAMSLSFVQRQPLVGMLRQAGVSGLDLMRALAIELFTFIVISWICGNILGYILSMYLAPHFYISLDDVASGSMFNFIEWKWTWCLLSFILASFGAASACVWPLFRLLKSRPIRLTARLSLIRFAGSECSIQAIIALILIVISVIMYQFTMTPITALMILALVLIAVALLAPYIIWKAFDFFSYRLKGVKQRWFFADAAASMSYRGIATMAFLIALSANIGVETLTGSFRSTTGDWLSKRLSADLYIYASPENYQPIQTWLEKQPNISHVWERWERDLTTDNGILQMVSVGKSEAERISLTVKVAVPDYWSVLHNSRSVMISESTALKLHLRPGDNIYLPQPIDSKWTIAGVYYDYGNPFYQVIMPTRKWQHFFSDEGDITLSVATKEHSSDSQAMIEQALMQRYQLDSERIYGVGTIRHLVMDTFDRTFAAAKALGTITLVIAVVGIFFATIAGEVTRQRHFALLRCFGVSNKELIFIGGLQLLIFGVIALVIALPLGIGLSQMVINTLVKETFGWSIQLHPAYLEYAKTIFYSLFALVSAGVIPLIKLLTRSPMQYFRDAL